MFTYHGIIANVEIKLAKFSSAMLHTVDEKLSLIEGFPYNVMPRSKVLMDYEERMKKVLTGLGFGTEFFHRLLLMNFNKVALLLR